MTCDSNNMLFQNQIVKFSSKKNGFPSKSNDGLYSPKQTPKNSKMKNKGGPYAKSQRKELHLSLFLLFQVTGTKMSFSMTDAKELGVVKPQPW